MDIYADFRPPREIDALLRAFELPKMFTSPVTYGLENIPETRPLLFVGNHTLMGLLDLPFLMVELYAKKRIFLRGLGDHVHFKIPVWGDLLTRYGAVDGTRENCAKLMQGKQCVLVFPGGAREVNKRKGEKYELIWGERLGFARLAIQNDCTILPFSSVGADDAFDIVLDAGDLLNSRMGDRLRERAGKRAEVMMPLLKGVGPTPLPRLERLYFKFGQPISTAEYAGNGDDVGACRDVRDKTKAAIEEGLAFLLEQRDADSYRTPLRRFWGTVRRQRRFGSRPEGSG